MNTITDGDVLFTRVVSSLNAGDIEIDKSRHPSQLVKSLCNRHKTTESNLYYVKAMAHVVDYYSSTNFISDLINDENTFHILQRMFMLVGDGTSKRGFLSSIGVTINWDDPIRFVDDIMLMLKQDHVIPLELFAGLFGHPNVDMYYFLHPVRYSTSIIKLSKIEQLTKSYIEWFKPETFCRCLYRICESMVAYNRNILRKLHTDRYYAKYGVAGCSDVMFDYVLMRTAYLHWCSITDDNREIDADAKLSELMKNPKSNVSRTVCAFKQKECYVNPLIVIYILNRHDPSDDEDDDGTISVRLGSRHRRLLSDAGCEYFEIPRYFITAVSAYCKDLPYQEYEKMFNYVPKGEKVYSVEIRQRAFKPMDEVDAVQHTSVIKPINVDQYIKKGTSHTHIAYPDTYDESDSDGLGNTDEETEYEHTESYKNVLDASVPFENVDEALAHLGLSRIETKIPL